MRIDSLNLLVLTGSLAYHLINTKADLKQILFSGLMWWINELTSRNISTDDNAKTCAQMFPFFSVSLLRQLGCIVFGDFMPFSKESDRNFGWMSFLDIVTCTWKVYSFIDVCLFCSCKMKNCFGWLDCYNNPKKSLLQFLASVTSKELLTELYQELFLWFSLNYRSRKTLLEVVKKPFVVLRNG